MGFVLLDYVLQLALNGILIGLVYGLIGLGLSLVLGIMGVLNISHGALYMLGGYLAYAVTTQMHLSPIVGVMAAIGGIFVVGLFIERILIEPVSNDQTSVMMITFGLAIILSQVALLIWGGYPVSNAEFLTSSLTFGRFYADPQIVISSIIGIVIAIMTILFLRKTKIGKAMRMVSQNREAASIVGVSSTRVFALALGIGSSFAGLAGALLTAVYSDAPSAEWTPLIAAFVVVVVGGLGSVAGSMIGGLIYGILLQVGDAIIPSGSDILVLVLIILIILVRPSGLFGSKDRV